MDKIYSAKNKNTYPKIIIDKEVNFPNSNNNIKSLTVEEWNDMLHHTHDASALVFSDGQTITETITTIVEENIKLRRYLDEELVTLKQDIQDLKDNANGSLNIGDWDAETDEVDDNP